MTRSADSDDGLVRALVAEYGAPLLRYVLRLVDGDRSRAEDIVQETLLRAWQHPEVAANFERSPRAWLYAVARNLVVDDFRGRSARPRETRMVDDLDIGSDDGGIGNALTHFEVIDAIRALAPQHRAVLLALYYRDLSVADAAHELGVPQGTVKSRAHYALRALRIQCEERGLLP